MAGGIDIGHLTLRQLSVIVDQRQRDAWLHTSCLVAAIHNGQLQRQDGKLWTASDFDPFVQAEKFGNQKLKKVSPQEFIARLNGRPS